MDAFSASLDRVHQFDALRGFAVLMILFANIFAFAFPLELSETAGFFTEPSYFSQIQHQVYQLFIRGKFICLLTLLFGASLYLLWHQSEGFDGKLKARMLALLLFGACHAVFVWSGDVLFVYAVTGLGLVMQQVFRWSSEQQLRYAKTYLVAGLVLPALVWLLPSNQNREQGSIAQFIDIYTGPYLGQLWLQGKHFLLLLLDLAFVSYWWFGGVMLLAIWGMQLDWQQLLKKYTNQLLCIAFGTAALAWLSDHAGSAKAVLNPLQFVSDLSFALLYVRLFQKCLALSPRFTALLVSCGRCALSLYLWQSICMVLLFRWVCPQCFGTLDRVSLSWIAFFFIMLQLYSVQRYYQAGRLWWFEQLYRRLAGNIEAKLLKKPG